MCRQFAKNCPYGRKDRCAAAAIRKLYSKVMRRTGKTDSAMKKILTISILTGLMLCGCQKEELKIEKTTEQKTFTAEIESNSDGAATKTSLDDQGNVLWNTGDQVSIFAGTTVNAQYQVSDDSNGQTRATLNQVSGSESETGTEISANVAYYPYSNVTLATTETGYTISGITLPATQTYAQASFASGAFPMAAVTASKDDNSLKFKNILGGLKLQLTGTAKVRSISVSGNNNEILCGSANVTVSSSDGVPAITLTDAAATTVTLDCGTEGVQLNETTATPFIIALPPMTFSKGFTVTVTDTDGKEMTITTAKSKTVQRSQLLKMASKVYKGESPFTLTSTGETSVSFVKNEEPADISLQYSKNSGAWTDYTVGTSITLADGETLKFRAGDGGNATFSTGYNDYYSINTTGTGTIKASGNIMSLLDKTLAKNDVPEFAFWNLFRNNGNLTDAANLKLPATTLANSCYSQMFYSCTALTVAPELPATTLAEYCYSGMFSGTALTEAPALPATTLAESCYESMFSGCESLIKAPKLNATALVGYCYGGMFEGCTSLEAAPDLPATTLAEECYYGMFTDCTGLKTAPVLKAEELAAGCYYEMFSGCTSLEIAPALNATKLAENCYYQMFNGCTSLKTAPELKSEEMACYCYYGMFRYCTSLTTAPKLPAETLAEYCYASMFSGCTGLTSAPELNATTLAKDCYIRMFKDCTSLTTAPELPATTLANYCYASMFNGCTGLTAAPELPATTLAEYCYYEMFNDCKNLNYVKALFTEIDAEDCIQSWLDGVSSTGTFVMNSTASWTASDLNLPSGWTITKAE